MKLFTHVFHGCSISIEAKAMMAPANEENIRNADKNSLCPGNAIWRHTSDKDLSQRCFT